MPKSVRHQVEAKVHTLEARRAQLQAELARTRRYLRTLAQRDHHAHLRQLGTLVVLAGLDTVAPEVVLGLLLEGATRVQDPVTQQRWQACGAQHLATQGRPGATEAPSGGVELPPAARGST